MLIAAPLIALLAPAVQGAPFFESPLPEIPSGDPRDAALFANLCEAQDLLHAAVEAHGGARFVTGATSYRITATGRLDFQAHLARPWASHAFELTSTTLVSGPDQLTRHQLQLTRSGSQNTQTSISLMGPNSGLLLELGAPESKWLQDAGFATQRAQDLQHLPWFHLARALEHAGELTLLPSPPDIDLIQVRLASGARWALVLGHDDHLLKRAESLAHWPGKGDRLDWIEFQGYVQTTGIPVPTTVRMHVEAPTVQEDYSLRLSDFELDPNLPLGGVVPAEQREAFGDLTRIQAPATAGLLVSHDLGMGVFALELPSESARSLLVEFADFCIVIESGGTSENGAAVLDTAAALWPNKPVRYLAMSHHHRISASGLRPYVQRGVTLLATAGNVAYLNDLATRPYRIAPDAQARAPRKAVIEVIETARIFEDATQRLELHVFNSSTHTDEYVLSFVPGSKLATIGDLLYLTATPAEQSANSRSLALYDLIRALGLDVETITQTWPLEPAYERIPFALLAAQVANARR